MAGAFSAGSSSGSASSTTTITLAATYGAGERIVVWVKYASTTITASVADTLGSTWNQIGGSGGYVPDSSGNRVAMFEALGVSAGSPTITVTFSSAVTNRAAAYYRGTGLDSNAAQAGTGQNQDGVATTANAATTGNMTPSSQPNVFLGMSITRFFAVTVAAGTSFTSLGAITGYNSIAGDTSLAEYRRTTSTSAAACTWTAGTAGDSFHSIGAVFGEAGAGGGASPSLMGRMHMVMP